ncbi:MAG: aldehyde dehydrogenase, partial [Planctomycetes bacterium]|nr:aldehyde dehydrogenase [Planctomycetota bacterium]
MAVKVGINGFGRIGRLTFRAIQKYAKGQVEVVG